LEEILRRCKPVMQHQAAHAIIDHDITKVAPPATAAIFRGQTSTAAASSRDSSYGLQISMNVSMNINSRLPKGGNAAWILIGAVAIAALAWLAGRKISATHINIITSDTLFLPLLYDERFFGSRLHSSSCHFPDFLY
jgi:hypothetical protein